MARKLEVQIVGDASGLQRAFNRASSSSSGFGKKMGTVGKFAGLALAGLGGAAAIAGKRMLDMASDAEEVRSKMEVVFGKQLPGLTKEIDKFSQATGVSRFAMREQVADMGALLAPLTENRKEAAKMSLQFTKLAADLGSFNNVPTADALLAIRSGLVGESEPLRRFGVLLNEAAVKNEALRLGLIKGKEAMTEQEKVQARASLIMQQTSIAQGDATRTAGSMANQMKMLQNSVMDAATSIGIALIPHALRAVQAFNTHWPTIERVTAQVFERVGQVIDALRPVISRVITIIRGLVSAAQDAWPKVQEAAARVVAWYRGTLQPAIQNVIAALRAIWAKFGADITAIARTAFNTARALIVAAMRVIQGVVEAVLAAIRGDWSQAWNSLKQVVSNVLKGVGAILTGFTSIAFQAMAAVGRALIDGIIAGASGIGERLGGFLRDKIGSAINSVKGAFGISSPSKVTEQQIGRPLADGIMVGLDGGLALLTPVMQKRLKAATDRLEAQASAARDRLARTFGGFADKMLRAFDAETGGTLTPAEAQIQQIQDARRQADLQKGLEDALAGGDADAIARAREAIQLDALEKQASVERKAYEDQRATMRENLEKRLTDLQEHFGKEGSTVKAAMLALQRLMRQYGVTFAESGAFVGKSFAAGFLGAANAAVAGAAGVRNAGIGGNPLPDVNVFVDGEKLFQINLNQQQKFERSNGSLGAFVAV